MLNSSDRSCDALIIIILSEVNILDLITTVDRKVLKVRNIFTKEGEVSKIVIQEILAFYKYEIH